MNINDYINYEEKTIAEFKVAIAKTENLFLERMKNKDVIGALEAIKLKVKLESLLRKKINEGSKYGYENHTRK